MSNQKTKRPYRKRARKEQEAATRRRIAEAAMELHGSIGPARTTLSGVAERARVQRATLYRHFPDEESLFMACSAHWMSLHPPPDAAAWSEIADPQERLARALTDLYAWYASDEAMFVNVFRDAAVMPSMQRVVSNRMAAFDAMLTTLLKGRPVRGRHRYRVRAATQHAIAFPTWHSLSRQGGLSDDEAIALMLATVSAAVEGA